MHKSLRCRSLWILKGIFAFQLIGFKPLKYNNEYEYPPWAQGFGLMLALVSMCCIPFYVVGKLLSLKGPIKEVGIINLVYCCIDDKFCCFETNIRKINLGRLKTGDQLSLQNV